MTSVKVQESIYVNLLTMRIDTVINTLLGRVTRHPSGMHCPSRDDAFVSSLFINLFIYYINLSIYLCHSMSFFILTSIDLNRLLSVHSVSNIRLKSAFVHVLDNISQ